MAEIIATIIFIGSLCGMAVICYRKIPALESLSVEDEARRNVDFSGAAEKIKQVNPMRFTCFEKFLKKFLLRVRIFNLKIENNVNYLLKKAREAREKKNDILDDNKDSKEIRAFAQDDIEGITTALKKELAKKDREKQEKNKANKKITKAEKMEPVESGIEKAKTLAENQGENPREIDNYWEELKKIKKKKITRRRKTRANKKD